MYQKCLSASRTSCCIRFVEVASINMVSERIVLLSFCDIDNFINSHLYSLALLLVELYLILLEA